MARRIEITAEFDIGDLVEFAAHPRHRSLTRGRVRSFEVKVGPHTNRPYIVYCVARETGRGCYYPPASTMRLIERALPPAGAR